MEIFKIYGIIKRKIKEIIHMPFVAAPVKIPEDIHHILSKFSKSRILPARQVQRAKIILLAADGMNNMQISTRVGPGQQPIWNLNISVMERSASSAFLMLLQDVWKNHI